MEKDKKRKEKEQDRGEDDESWRNGDQSQAGWGKMNKKWSGEGQGVREMNKKCEKTDKENKLIHDIIHK